MSRKEPIAEKPWRPGDAYRWSDEGIRKIEPYPAAPLQFCPHRLAAGLTGECADCRGGKR